MKNSLLITLLLSSFEALPQDCLIKDEMLKNATSDMGQVLSQVNCQSATPIKSRDDLDHVIQTLLANQALQLADTPDDRHKVGEKLNDCSPEKDSQALVINFAGTGAFNPRGFHVMRELLSCYGDQELPENLKKKIFYSIAIQDRKANPESYKWSGIEAGPMNQFFSDPFLKTKGKVLDFAVFASEEAEVYGDQKNISLKKIIVGNKTPPGIAGAQACVTKYLAEAKKLSIKPKIIVLTHSSGGRSAVKFAERVKAQGVNLDLVFSMDPVKEAQKAMLEVAGQYATFKKNVAVHSRKQPDALYKTSNASRWVNVYQNVDTEGLKTKMKFGIHGSPVHEADKNVYIKDGMGSAAHGEIAYSPETTNIFIEEMKTLLKD